VKDGRAVAADVCVPVTFRLR